MEWSYEDKVKLIDSILDCGYDNWTDVALKFHNKTALECKTYYLDKFITNPDNDDLRKIVSEMEEFRKCNSVCKSRCSLSVESTAKDNYHSAVDFLDTEQYVRNLCNEEKCLNDKTSFKDDNFKDTNQLDCVRRIKHVMSNISCTNFNPFRSEFDVEYDDNAESVLEALWEPPETAPLVHPDDERLSKQLKYAMVDSYNMRLRDRLIRKQIIKMHGLIDRFKTYSMIQRFDVPFGKSYLTTLFSFMKLLKGPNLDFLAEKLIYENELRNKLNALLTYRTLGLRFLNCIHIYEKLNKKRLKYKKEIGYNGSPLIVNMLQPRSSKRPSAPLTLYNLPGFNLLDEDEKHLCSISRIVPETYYNFKQLLISECRKHDGLKLAQARQLLKIDVNKTRKMFDFLLSTGDIW